MKKYRRFFLWCAILIAGGVAGVLLTVMNAAPSSAAGKVEYRKTTEEDFAGTDVTPGAFAEELPKQSELKNAEKEETCIVFVCGAVRKEGVYSVSSFGRIADAIEAAGGFSPEADTSYLNLAGKITDGVRIYVPTKEEAAKMPSPSANLPQKEDYKAPGKINLNKASAADLMRLPGIGEAKAEKILEYRKKVGDFLSPEDIMNVSGIGEAIFQNIKDQITTEE